MHAVDAAQQPQQQWQQLLHDTRLLAGHKFWTAIAVPLPSCRSQCAAARRHYPAAAATAIALSAAVALLLPLCNCQAAAAVALLCHCHAVVTVPPPSCCPTGASACTAASRHTTALHSPASPHAPPPLITLLLCLLFSWLSRGIVELAFPLDLNDAVCRQRQP